MKAKLMLIAMIALGATSAGADLLNEMNGAADKRPITARRDGTEGKGGCKPGEVCPLQQAIAPVIQKRCRPFIVGVGVGSLQMSIERSCSPLNDKLYAVEMEYWAQRKGREGRYVAGQLRLDERELPEAARAGFQKLVVGWLGGLTPEFAEFAVEEIYPLLEARDSEAAEKRLVDYVMSHIENR